MWLISIAIGIIVPLVVVAVSERRDRKRNERIGYRRR